MTCKVLGPTASSGPRHGSHDHDSTHPVIPVRPTSPAIAISMLRHRLTRHHERRKVGWYVGAQKLVQDLSHVSATPIPDHEQRRIALRSRNSARQPLDWQPANPGVDRYLAALPSRDVEYCGRGRSRTDMLHIDVVRVNMIHWKCGASSIDEAVCVHELRVRTNLEQACPVNPERCCAAPRELTIRPRSASAAC